MRCVQNGEHGERLALIVTLFVPMNIYQVALIIKLHFMCNLEKIKTEDPACFFQSTCDMIAIERIHFMCNLYIH